jgi:hypothetical protein
MTCGCKDRKDKKCGEGSNMSKEEQLAHLRDCKGQFELKIKEIDEAIAKLDN